MSAAGSRNPERNIETTEIRRPDIKPSGELGSGGWRRLQLNIFRWVATAIVLPIAGWFLWWITTTVMSHETLLPAMKVKQDDMGSDIHDIKADIKTLLRKTP